MKRKKESPLELLKEFVARLDESQLREIVGGVKDEEVDESCGITSCSGGTTRCVPQAVAE